MIENKKILLEQYKKSILEDDSANKKILTQKLLELIPEDKRDELSTLFERFITVCKVYKTGLIKEPNLKSIEEAILERLEDKEVAL
jgi:hypothetical protein